MPVTHGGRARRFEWSFRDDEVLITSESGIRHQFTTNEILQLIRELDSSFGSEWIPLGNNVEKLYSGTEKLGLGTAIYGHRPGDTLHAQGASYLGVVLEEIGVFRWNGMKKGIAWRIEKRVADLEALEALLHQSAKK